MPPLCNTFSKKWWLVSNALNFRTNISLVFAFIKFKSFLQKDTWHFFLVLHHAYNEHCRSFFAWHVPLVKGTCYANLKWCLKWCLKSTVMSVKSTAQGVHWLKTLVNAALNMFDVHKSILKGNYSFNQKKCEATLSYYSILHD